MLAKLRIKFWWLTAGAARRAGGLLYATTSAPRHDPFSIPAEYARVFFPLMYLLWGLALASQIVEIYGLPERQPEPSAYWPAQVAAYADFVIRFGSLAFGLTILLIPVTIVLVKLGRLLMTIARRIENRILPASIREQINTAVDKATSETRIQRDQAWQEWLARRDQAHTQGQPFDEPPPSETTATN